MVTFQAFSHKTPSTRGGHILFQENVNSQLELIIETPGSDICRSEHLSARGGQALLEALDIHCLIQSLQDLYYPHFTDGQLEAWAGEVQAAESELYPGLFSLALEILPTALDCNIQGNVTFQGRDISNFLSKGAILSAV